MVGEYGGFIFTSLGWDIKTHCTEETAKDAELQRVIAHLQKGWIKGKCPQYFPLGAELSVIDGTLLQKNRVVIPASICQDLLRRIQEKSNAKEGQDKLFIGLDLMGTSGN